MKQKRGHGQGSIRARGGRFEAAVMVGGKRRIARFDTRTEATDWIASIRTDVRRGVISNEAERKRIRFDDLCRALQAAKTGALASKRWRPGTLRFYTYQANGVLVPHFGHIYVDEITPELIEEFKRKRHETGVSPATINLHLQVLRQVLNFAVKKRYLKWSPMSAVERLDTEEHNRLRKEKQRVLRAHEIRAFLEALPNLQQRAFFTVLFFCGLRRGEIFRMRTEWLDFEDAMLHVRIAKRGSSSIPMSPRVVKVLTELMPKPGAFVFPPRPQSKGWEAQQNGDNVERLAMRRALPDGLRAAGINPAGISFHVFRRSFVTLVERLPGVSYSVVRDLARHGAVNVTDRYMRPPVEDLRKALVALEAAVFGTKNVLVLPAQSSQ